MITLSHPIHGRFSVNAYKEDKGNVDKTGSYCIGVQTAVTCPFYASIVKGVKVTAKRVNPWCLTETYSGKKEKPKIIIASF